MVKYECKCGCKQMVKWNGKGTQPLYFSNACRQRAYRARLSQVISTYRMWYATQNNGGSQ